MYDEFLLKYRYLIGGILIAIILAGLGTIFWEKNSRKKSTAENNIIAELRIQNDQLREQLSNTAKAQIAGASTSEDQGDKININTASAAELDKLPNIGPARAADIVAYRESRGGFKTIEEIKNIKGIGDKSFESLKDLITAGN